MSNKGSYNINRLISFTETNNISLLCEYSKVTRNTIISGICKIKKGMKILEIGFGEGDFMNYIRKEYNIDIVGVSIAEEQVKLVKIRFKKKPR
jgi:ubiquinone/menaquinone biosynthesis C-methylase UbiE